MKLLWRSATLVVALVIAALLLAACEGEGEEEVAPATTATPAATEEAAPATTATPAATEEAAPTKTPDPQDFAEFADLIAQAVAEGDSSFFAERVKGATYTCTQNDIGAEVEGIEQGLCQNVGQQLDLVQFGYWRSEGLLRRPVAMASQIEIYFIYALPEENDSYGTGAVRLYAIGTGRSSDGQTFRAAILTAITGRPEASAIKPARTARGIHFEYVEGRWLIRGMLVADVLAEELLSPETAPYTEWEQY